MASSLITSQRNSLRTVLTRVGDCFCLNGFLIDLINLISIPGDTDQTDEKLETAEVERRDRAETELDLHTESLGKIIDIQDVVYHLIWFEYIIEMDVLQSDGNKTLHEEEEETEEMTPLETELTDEDF